MKMTKAFTTAMARLFDSPEAAAQRELDEWNAKPTRQSVRREAFKADKAVGRIIARNERMYR